MKVSLFFLFIQVNRIYSTLNAEPTLSMNDISHGHLFFFCFISCCPWYVFRIHDIYRHFRKVNKGKSAQKLSTRMWAIPLWCCKSMKPKPNRACLSKQIQETNKTYRLRFVNMRLLLGLSLPIKWNVSFSNTEIYPLSWLRLLLSKFPWISLLSGGNNHLLTFIFLSRLVEDVAKNTFVCDLYS